MGFDPIEMMCRELVELVTDYLSGSLGPADRARFEEHLHTCPPCTVYLAQMRDTIALTSGLAGTASAAATEQALVDLFRRWHRK